LIAPHKIQEGIPMFSSPAFSPSGLIKQLQKIKRNDERNENDEKIIIDY
jgi:hypothetical protein